MAERESEYSEKSQTKICKIEKQPSLKGYKQRAYEK